MTKIYCESCDHSYNRYYYRKKHIYTKKHLKNVKNHQDHNHDLDDYNNMNVLTYYYYKNLITTDVDCSICLDKITHKTDYLKTNCNHEFHLSCIDHWAQINNSCPLCRRQVF